MQGVLEMKERVLSEVKAELAHSKAQALGTYGGESQTRFTLMVK